MYGDLSHNNAVTLRANVVPSLSGNFFTVDLDRTQATGDAQQPVPQVVLFSATYLACSPTGCLADAAVAADLIGRLSAARTVNVTFTSLNGGKRITVPVPLTGFGDAAGVLGLAQK